MAAVAALRPPIMATDEALGGIHQLLDRLDTGDVVGGTAAGALLGEVDRAIRRLQSVRLALVALRWSPRQTVTTWRPTGG